MPLFSNDKTFRGKLSPESDSCLYLYFSLEFQINDIDQFCKISFKCNSMIYSQLRNVCNFNYSKTISWFDELILIYGFSYVIISMVWTWFHTKWDVHIIINLPELIRKQIDIAFVFMHDQFRICFSSRKVSKFVSWNYLLNGLATRNEILRR